jgi:hypothetical protein
MSGSDRPPEMLSDHPDPGNRVAAINEILPSLKLASSPVRDTQEFQQVKARLGGAALRSSPEPERVGPRDPNDMKPAARPEPPSASYSTFSAADDSFTFRAPDNWDALSTDGGETNLIFAPPGAYGEVKGSVYVTHGIFVGAVQPPAGDLEAAVNIFVREQIRANPDFGIRGEPQAITFSDGRKGYAVVVAGPSTVTGVVEIDVIYTTVTSDGRLFYLITMAPEDEYERYQPAFEQIIRSLQFGR